jgi:hypothetical protein
VANLRKQSQFEPFSVENAEFAEEKEEVSVHCLYIKTWKQKILSAVSAISAVNAKYAKQSQFRISWNECKPLFNNGLRKFSLDGGSWKMSEQNER